MGKLFLLVFLMGQLYSDNYALSTGEQDRERLMILNEIHNGASLAALEITPGLSVLTIGCGVGLLELDIARRTDGVVVGTDMSSEQLQIAEEFKDGQLDNLRFEQLNALDVGKITGQFDRIHCRFILTHLPLDKAIQIAEILYTKVSPGGFLLLEEIATIDSLYCEPSHPGYDKWKMGFQKQIELQSSDPAPGQNIYRYLKEMGYTASYSSYQPALSTPRQKSILSLGVMSASKKFLQDGVMSLEEIEELLDLLHDLEQDNSYLPRYNELSQIKIQKS